MLPAIGTRAVHKEDYAKLKGPVWEVSGSYVAPDEAKVKLKPADHKLNHTGEVLYPKEIPLKEFKDDYRTL